MSDSSASKSIHSHMVSKSVRIVKPEAYKAGILSAIGNTPLVKLTNLQRNPKVSVYAKLEGCNPGGSVKDRPAYYMVKAA